jgi:hypothetical protein
MIASLATSAAGRGAGVVGDAGQAGTVLHVAAQAVQLVAGLRADDQAALRVALRLADLAEQRHDLVRDDDVPLAGLRVRQVQHLLPPVDLLPAEVPDLVAAHAGQGSRRIAQMPSRPMCPCVRAACARRP